MKYRVLNPNEIEAYNIGYKVGSRQIVIADIEWESPEEKKFYRQGYNAGCQDRLRRNVSNVSNITNTAENQTTDVSNVSNINNVKSNIVIVNDIVNKKGGVGGKMSTTDVSTSNTGQSRSNEVKVGQTGQNNQNIQKNQNEIQIDNQVEKKEKFHNALEIFGNAYKATDAVVGVFDKPDGTTHEGIRIKNPRLMAFVRQRFDKSVLSKVSDWAIDHNQRGHTYNATSLLKLLCKFQSNVEPTINFNSVQSEFLTFEYKQPQK